MAVDKSRLRSVLKKLLVVPHGGDLADVMTAPQEMLDFLAMLAGLKPVFLLGRGMDDASWVSGITDLAKSMGLHVERGPHWHGVPSNLPPWIVEVTAKRDGSKQATYISKARAIAQEVTAINTAGGRLAVPVEARLLGYPECCVASHYDALARVDRLYTLLLRRVGGGHEERMRQLVVEDVAMAPETVEELDLARSLTPPKQIAFTSINACAVCATDPKSPARSIGARYRALAEAVDTSFAEQIAMNAGA